jgi:hypothetical protein
VYQQQGRRVSCLDGGVVVHLQVATPSYLYCRECRVVECMVVNSGSLSAQCYLFSMANWIVAPELHVDHYCVPIDSGVSCGDTSVGSSSVPT